MKNGWDWFESIWRTAKVPASGADCEKYRKDDSLDEGVRQDIRVLTDMIKDLME